MKYFSVPITSSQTRHEVLLCPHHFITNKAWKTSLSPSLHHKQGMKYFSVPITSSQTRHEILLCPPHLFLSVLCCTHDAEPGGNTSTQRPHAHLLHGENTPWAVVCVTNISITLFNYRCEQYSPATSTFRTFTIISRIVVRCFCSQYKISLIITAGDGMAN